MLEYPQNEQVFYKRNSAILNEWNRYISDKKIIDGYDSDLFVADGFYPFYYSQKIKILFIAAECLGLAGCDYIECLYNAYKKNKIGRKHINQHKFHNLMFYVTYGIENNFMEWDDLPLASEMTNDFATKYGISFSFMELSKYSNESNSFQKDFTLMNNFIECSKNENINYWNEQIKILDPDVIITMKLKWYIENGILGETLVIDNQKYPREYFLNLGNKKIKIIDTYHFAYWPKKSKNYFYDPILNILKIT
jgi:hypothetical protein